MKRFAITKQGFFTKINGHVPFPEVLDVAPYMAVKKEGITQADGTSMGAAEDNSGAGPTLYRLTGVVVHSGGLSGGHYIAYVRYGEPRPSYWEGMRLAPDCGDCWAHVSDSSVGASTLTSALGCEAYLLFYERVTIAMAA